MRFARVCVCISPTLVSLRSPAVLDAGGPDNAVGGARGGGGGVGVTVFNGSLGISGTK